MQHGMLRAGVALLGVTALIAAACASPTPTPTPEPAPVSFNVAVGAEDKLSALELMTFLPGDLTVNAGDSIVYTLKTAEPHTVTFNVPDPWPGDFLPQADGRLMANPQEFFPFPPPAGPPGPPPAGPPPPLNLSVNFDGTGYLNSGFMQNPAGDVFKVTFTKAGKYPYVCLLHGLQGGHMTGTITVNPAGTAYTKKAADYDKDGADHLAVHKTNAEALRNAARTALPQPIATADGSRTFVSFAAAADTKGNEFAQFFGGTNLTIKAGDKVTWKLEKNNPGTPHTISFLSGAPTPDLIVVEPPMHPGEPPSFFLNPAILPPSPLPPSSTYAGTGLYSSGALFTGFPPGVTPPPGFPATPQEFTLTFTKAGTYKYLCFFHDSTGMNGTITVQP